MSWTPKHVQLNTVRRNGNLIRNFINGSTLPDKDVQLAAVNENGNAIKYLVNERLGLFPDKDVQLAAVSEHGLSLRYISHIADDDVKLAAVKENPEAIRYISDPNDLIQFTAVSLDGDVIKRIHNPSVYIQDAAVKHGTQTAECHVRNLRRKQCEELERQKNAERVQKEWEEEQCHMDMIEADPSNIVYIPNPSERLIMAATIQRAKQSSNEFSDDPLLVKMTYFLDES